MAPEAAHLPAASQRLASLKVRAATGVRTPAITFICDDEARVVSVEQHAEKSVRVRRRHPLAQGRSCGAALAAPLLVVLLLSLVGETAAPRRHATCRAGARLLLREFLDLLSLAMCGQSSSYLTRQHDWFFVWRLHTYRTRLWCLQRMYDGCGWCAPLCCAARCIQCARVPDC